MKTRRRVLAAVAGGVVGGLGLIASPLAHATVRQVIPAVPTTCPVGEAVRQFAWPNPANRGLLTNGQFGDGAGDIEVEVGGFNGRGLPCAQALKVAKALSQVGYRNLVLEPRVPRLQVLSLNGQLQLPTVTWIVEPDDAEDYAFSPGSFAPLQGGTLNDKGAKVLTAVAGAIGVPVELED